MGRAIRPIRNQPVDLPAKYDGRVQCFCEIGGGQALRIEYSYARPPQRPEPSYLAHHQKGLLNRLYFTLIHGEWL